MNNLSDAVSATICRGETQLIIPDGQWAMGAQIKLPVGFVLQLGSAVVQAAPGVGGFEISDKCAILGGTLRGCSNLTTDRYTAGIFNTSPTSDFELFGTQLENWGSSISLTAASSVRIANCAFNGWRTMAIRIVGDSGQKDPTKSRSVQIRNNTLENTFGQYGPDNGVTTAESMLICASDVLIDRNKVNGGATRTNGVIQGTRDGIFLSYCQNVTVTRNVSHSHGDDGITIFRSYGSGGFDIHDNLCYGSLNTVGIYGLATQDTPIKGLSLVNNTCYGNTYAGIYILNAIAPKVLGNSVFLNGTGNSSDQGPGNIAGAGILLHNTVDADVDANEVWHNQGVGIYAGSVNNNGALSYNKNCNIGTRNRTFGNRKSIQYDQ